MFTFSNFHDETTATFIQCDPLEREPDFISQSGSRYWDIPGHGVIRQSDHWIDGITCFSIRSCKWSLTTTNQEIIKTGFCRYSDFQTRIKKPIWYKPTVKDLEAAIRLQNVAIPSNEWIGGKNANTKKSIVPIWAQELHTDLNKDNPKIRKLLKTRPKIRKAIVADQSIIRKILDGATKIKIGERYLDDTTPEPHSHHRIKKNSQIKKSKPS